MQDNKYYRLIKYIKNVFDIEEQLKCLEDGRVNPTYQTEKVVLIILMGFLLRLSSLGEIDRYIKSGEFDNLFHLGLSYHT